MKSKSENIREGCRGRFAGGEELFLSAERMGKCTKWVVGFEKNRESGVGVCDVECD